MAKLIKSLGNKLTAYVVGVENSQDFESAEKAAKEIGIKLRKILVAKKEIEESILILKNIFDRLYEKYKSKSNSEVLKPSPISISFSLPLFFVVKYSEKKYIVSGQGADELLGGYNRYLNLSKTNAVKEMNQDANLLIDLGQFRDKKIGEIFNKQVLMPYLNKEIAEFCISLPYELKIKDRQRKYILRKLGKKIGLSKNIAYKEKKAAQYSSGIMKVMKEIAKSRNQGLGDYINSLNK